MSFSPSLINIQLPSPNTVEDMWGIINSNLKALPTYLPSFLPDLIVTGLNYPDPVETIKNKLNVNLGGIVGLVEGFAPQFLLFNQSSIIDGGSIGDAATITINGGTISDGYFLPIYNCGYVSTSVIGNMGYDTLLTIAQKMNNNFIALQELIG